MFIGDSDSSPCHPNLHATSVRQPDRQDLEPSPLGVFGNLQFSAGPGGGAPVSRAGAVLSSIYHWLAKLWAGLKFCLAPVFPQARAQCDYLLQVRKISGHIGNLLGSLTAPATDEESWLKVANELAKLSELPKDDPACLSGWRYCLPTYLDELHDSDLIALYNGALVCPVAREGVLRQLPSAHQVEANDVLNQVARALLPRFRRKVVGEPFGQIVTLLSARSMDGQKLREPLLRLANGLDQFRVSRQASCVPDGGHYLENYLQLLTDEQYGALQALAQQGIIECRESAMAGGLTALLRIEGEGRAYCILDHIRSSLAADLYEWPRV